MDMTLEAGRSIHDSVRQHAEKGILLLARRSRIAPEGSRFAQQAAMRDLVRYGVADLPCEVLEYTASAKKDADRERVNELIQRMGEGTVGLIVAGVGHWITRSQIDWDRLITAAHAHGVLFMVKGEILEPRDQHEHARLMEFIINEHLENAERQYLVALRRLSRRQRGTPG